MNIRIERTIVVIEKPVPELGNDTLLRAEVETDTGRVNFRYSSIETQAGLTFPASTATALAEFFTALAADPVMALISTPEPPTE